MSPRRRLRGPARAGLPPVARPLLSTPELLLAVDRAFRAGELLARAPPTRFFINLTERCCLACAHCINESPARTAAGTARDLDDEVLARLAPHLAYATYVAFSHAGEPTLFPALDRLLTILREVRQGEPFVVHLLTNGQHLTPARFAELAGLGICSWSFSVDGMSAATHDELRTGSRIGELLATIEAVAGLRRERFPWVRLGVAWTVTCTNVTQLAALLAFAARVGLDWVKLEELCVVNRASAELAAIAPTDLCGALMRARAQAEGLGIRILLHLDDLRPYACQLERDPAMAAFSRDDSYVNHTQIHRCREIGRAHV